MPRVVVYFQDRGRFPDRDALWYRVAAYRDGLYLGCWDGVLNGSESIASMSAVDGDEIQPAAVAATARKLAQTAEIEGFREKWSDEIPQVALDVGDVVQARSQRKHVFRSGEPVLTFELPLHA